VLENQNDTDVTDFLLLICAISTKQSIMKALPYIEKHNLLELLWILMSSGVREHVESNIILQLILTVRYGNATELEELLTKISAGSTHEQTLLMRCTYNELNIFQHLCGNN
jgi:hypothetical protein